MFDKKVIEDINRSAPSLGASGVMVRGFSGFVERIVKTYGAARVLRVVDRSELTPLHARWVKQWISGKGE